MSNNNALTYLVCRENQLTASALNDLFRTLTDKSVPKPPSDGRSIQINNNPGSQDCDRSIAEKKGWWFVGSLFKNW